MSYVNLNEEVWVRLTPLGHQVLAEDYEALMLQFPALRSMPAPALRTDPDGWTPFQLWQLMQTFGPHLGNGCPLVFEMDIRLSPSPEPS